MARHEIKGLINDNELNKINRNFKELYEAPDRIGGIADEAVSLSKEAINTANLAKESADSTRTELDAVIGEATDSDAMSRQAAVDAKGEDKKNLKKRLDDDYNEFASQLTEINHQLFYRPSVTELLNEFFRKLRYGESVKIVCMGDSLTYGYDIVSDNRRPADGQPTPNGTVHVRERASITYPEYLELCLNQVYEDGVSVINRGYSGDTVETSYPKWNTPHDGDVTMLMYGTNDSSKEIGIDAFIKGYRRLIERELRWGSACILLTPPRRLASDIRSEVYGNAVYQLGKEYGCPVIDMNEMTANVSANSFSDQTHFNDVGYRQLGARLAGLFIGEGVNKLPVYSGDTLLTREYVDSVKMVKGITDLHSINYPTVNERGDVGVNGEIRGIAVDLDSEGGKMVYSFYVEQDDILIYPSIFYKSDASKLDMILDFDVKSQGVSNVYMYDQYDAKYDQFVPSTVTLTKSDANWRPGKDAYYIKGAESMSEPKIHIPKKGWHTLTLDGSDVRIFSLDFISYNQMETYIHGKENGKEISEVLNAKPVFKPLSFQNGWDSPNSFGLQSTAHIGLGFLNGNITKKELDTSVITVLPVGHRPASTYKAVIALAGTSVVPDQFPAINIYPNGEVRLINAGDTTATQLTLNEVFVLA